MPTMGPQTRRFVSDLSTYNNQSGYVVPPAWQKAGAGGPAGDLAMSTLMDILKARGKTDPRAVNAINSTIATGTQANQDLLDASAARRGIGNSGVIDALKGAIGATGTQQMADNTAKQAQDAETRKRQDLMLFLQMILDPSMRSREIDTGIDQFNKDQDAKAKAAQMQAIGSFIGFIGAAI